MMFGREIGVKNVVGQAVVGENLYGRRREIDSLWQSLRQGNHVHILAPRRVGKTSLMLELRRVPPDGWHVVYVDVEGAESPADCVAAIMAELALAPKYRTWMEAVPFATALSDIWKRFAGIDVSAPFLRVELKSAMGDEWPGAMDQLQARFAALPQGETHLLVVIDELPVLIARMLRKDRGRDDVELLLAKMRGWRQSPILRGKFLTLLGGSVGLEGVLRRQSLTSLINDMLPFRLESWQRNTATEFLSRLACDNDVYLEAQHIRQILDLLQDPVPYHVQLFFHEIATAVHDQSAKVSEQLIRDCFANRLTGPSGTAHLDHYATRLEFMLEPDRYAVARSILEHASRPGGVNVGELKGLANAGESILRSVLNELDAEGYLFWRDDRIQFRSNLFRVWWRKQQSVAATT